MSTKFPFTNPLIHMSAHLLCSCMCSINNDRKSNPLALLYHEDFNEQFTKILINKDFN